MIYVTAGICGRFEKYKKLLEKINLRTRDDFYVVGDIIGERSGSLKILEDMSMRTNVFPVLGDNEYIAHKFMSEIADNSGKLLNKVPESMKAEYRAAVYEFTCMDNDGRAWVMEYLSEMPLYEEVIVGGREYLLVHSGIGDFLPNKNISDYGINELAFSDTDYSRCYYPDKILVTGHCPTYKIDKHYRGQVYRNGMHLSLNCADEDGGYLAAVCLETGEEYYV